LLANSRQNPARLDCPRSADAQQATFLAARDPLRDLTNDAHDVLRLPQEKLVNLNGGSRNTNQIALYVRAAKDLSLLALLRCFNTLSMANS